MKSFEVVNAASVKEASELLKATPGSVLKAGGIDLVDEMKSGLVTPPRVVNLKGAKGLDQIFVDDKGTHIGPLVTLAQVADKFIEGARQVLGQAARNAATPQIRNVATVGGNLLQRPRCWYYRLPHVSCRKKGGTECPAIPGDNRYHAIFETQACPIVHPSSLAGPLISLDAELLLTGPAGDRTLPVGEFFSSKDVTRENVLQPGEVIREVVIPGKWHFATGGYQEAREKESFDWALASCSTVLEVQKGVCRIARVVLGAVAPVPWRSAEAEKILLAGNFNGGEPAIRAVADAAAKAAFAGAKPLSGNAHKIAIGTALVRRSILSICRFWVEEEGR